MQSESETDQNPYSRRRQSSPITPHNLTNHLLKGIAPPTHDSPLSRQSKPAALKTVKQPSQRQQNQSKVKSVFVSKLERHNLSSIRA